MSWQIRGQYIETCNCDYICPCVPSGMTESTHGTCIFAMAYQIDRGQYDGLSLNGLNFIVIGHTPGEMSEGNWNVGLIADERANPQQREALVAIVSGQGGGPMANLAPLIGKFLGVEARPIQFQGNGKSWSVAAPGLVDQALEAATGLGGRDAAPGQHRSPGQQPLCPGQSEAQPCPRIWHRLGRRERPQQRPVRPLRLERVIPAWPWARRNSGRRPLRQHDRVTQEEDR